MARLAYSLVATCALLFACAPAQLPGGDDDSDADAGPTGPHELSYIEVTPTNPIVELDLGVAGSQTFAVVGKYLDGVDEDLTQQVSWSIDNTAVGQLTNNVLDLPARANTGVDVARITVQMGAFMAQAQITVVAYRQSGANPDFFFVLPYQDPTGPATKPLEFGTAVPSMDVFFLMDTTGSMASEIDALKTGLQSTIVPGIASIIPDTQYGVAGFEDFPVSSYGGTQDQPVSLFQTITDNLAAVQTGINQLTLGDGGDFPEAGIEAIYQVITGEGITQPAPTNVPAASMGFRSSAMPVVVTITDAMMHEPASARSCTYFNPFFGSQVISAAYDGTLSNAHNRDQTKAALANKCARSVGVSTDAGLGAQCSGQTDLEEFATSTGARVPPAAWDVAARPAGCAATQCCTGINGVGRNPDVDGLCPLVFLADANGGGLGNHIVTGIQMLARFAKFDVTSDKSGPSTDINGVTLPDSHTTADFIKQVVPVDFVLPAAPPVVPDPTDDDIATFFGVTPNTRVKFDVKALNDFAPQTAEAQIFRATVRVLASGCTPLDQREVLILVPPQPISIQ